MGTLSSTGMPAWDQVIHLIGYVGLGAGAIDAVLDPDVELPIAHLHPEAAATFQRIRLRDLRQAEHIAIKSAGGRFVCPFNRYLYVMDANDHLVLFPVPPH